MCPEAGVLITFVQNKLTLGVDFLVPTVLQALNLFIPGMNVIENSASLEGGRRWNLPQMINGESVFV